MLFAAEFWLEYLPVYEVFLVKGQGGENGTTGIFGNGAFFELT